MSFSITTIIIIITVIASFYAWGNESVMNKWIFNPYSIHKNKEYQRFITSGLIHADYMHLGFNMIALYSFGRIVEAEYASAFGKEIGMVMYVVLYVAGMVVADIPDFMKYKNYSYYNALGASGAVSAVLFAGILFNPMMGIRILFIPINIPGFIFGLLYMLYSYFQAKRGGDNIGHNAHLFGAIFGLVFTAVTVPESIPVFLEQLKYINRFRFFSF